MLNSSCLGFQFSQKNFIFPTLLWKEGVEVVRESGRAIIIIVGEIQYLLKVAYSLVVASLLFYEVKIYVVESILLLLFTYAALSQLHKKYTVR